MSRCLRGLDVCIGVPGDIVDELLDADRRRQQQLEAQQRQMIIPRIGSFLDEHKWLILGGTAAVIGFWFLLPKGDESVLHWDYNEVPTFKEKKRSARSYEAIGASPAMRESALRVLRARRLDEKYKRELPIAKRFAMSAPSVRRRSA